MNNLKTNNRKLAVLWRGAVCAFALAILALAMPACEREKMPEPVNKVLLVYLAGDNNLRGESYQKLEAIKRGWHATSGSRVLVYHDASDTIPRFLEIPDTGKEVVIESYAQENSASKDVLSRVITKARSMYPDATFNFLAFSHSSGWLPDNTYANPRSSSSTRSIMEDRGRSMELADFADAIPDGAFDHIVLETCLMAGIEVVYQLRNKANYILASSAEIISPGFEPLYSNHTLELVNGDPKRFFKTAADVIINGNGHYKSGTFSIIRTDKLQALTQFVKNNCDMDMAQEVDVVTVQYFDWQGAGRMFFDFEDYYSRLFDSDAKRDELTQLIEECVEWKMTSANFVLNWQGFVINKHSGLTTYIMQPQYPEMNNEYTTLDWYKAALKR